MELKKRRYFVFCHNTFSLPKYTTLSRFLVVFSPLFIFMRRESAESNWPLLSSYHLKRCVCDIYRVIYLCCALLIVSYRRYVMLFICFYMRDQVM